MRDPAALKVARTLTLDGQYVNARQNGATARVVLSSTPRAYAVAGVRGRASGWLPRSRFASRISGRHRTRTMVACRAVRRPPTFSGLGTVSILTIDLDKGLWEVDADAVMTDAQTVYGSASHLYVATQRWIDPQTAPARPADDHDAHPPLRRLRPRPHDLRGQRRGPRLPAQPVLALRAGRRPARGLDRRSRVVAGPAAGLVAEPRDRPAPRRRDARPRRPRLRAGPGAAHLLGALHRRRRLRRDLPPGRSALHDRPRRSRRRRRSSASSSCSATPPTCTRSPTTSCSASGRTRRPRAGPRACRCRSSASATRPIPSCWPSTRSAPRPRRRSSSTATPSSTGPRASSSCCRCRSSTPAPASRRRRASPARSR